MINSKLIVQRIVVNKLNLKYLVIYIIHLIHQYVELLFMLEL